jgi:hypothetical protein
VRSLVWTVGGVVAVVGIVLVVGLLLPGTHTVTESRVVGGSPEEIWAVISDVERFPSWRPDVERVETLPERGGRAVWREYSSTGPMTLQVTEWTPFFRMTAEIADEDLGFGGRWTWELVRQPSGTQVTLTENGEVYNPFLRVFSRFFMDPEESITEYLDALDRRMAQTG